MSDPKDYTIGWISALALEFTAAQQFLDKKHGRPKYVHNGDENHYTLGSIGDHNVVIAVLGAGENGIAAAAMAAKDMMHSFPNVRLCVMVGIGGGAPGKEHDIRLGDVVVSTPTFREKNYGGVVHYDFAATLKAKSFESLHYMNQPPRACLAAVNAIIAKHRSDGNSIDANISDVLEKKPRLRREYGRPETSTDRLYVRDSTPIENSQPDSSNAETHATRLIQREPRLEDEDNPAVHYGLIASADGFMEDAEIRDILAGELGVLCFEMEAAGLMNQFPCLVIRGICDYSDAHWSKEWRGYAAMSAAAYAKDLLTEIPPYQLELEASIGSIIEKELYLANIRRTVLQASRDINKNIDRAFDALSLTRTQERPDTPPKPSIEVPFKRDRDFVRRDIMNEIEDKCGQPGSRTALVGFGGVGKSQLAIEYAYHIGDETPETWVFWIHASNRARFEQGFQDIATLVKIAGWQDPEANMLQLVHDWLRDKKKGPWIIILDNVDDASFLKLADSHFDTVAPTPMNANPKQLIAYIPYCQHGSVLITSRSRSAALELVERADIISIKPMEDKDALQLFRNKLGQNDKAASIVELAAALDFMPLAMAQASAYILQRRPRYSLQKYIDEFCKSDRRKADLLGLKDGKLRQDAEANILGLTGEEFRRDAESKNSILLTWQISFDYIRKTRSSAADLLSLMSFCDRQGIPEFLLHGQDDPTCGDSEQNQREGKGIKGIEDEPKDEDKEEEERETADIDSDCTEQQSSYSDNDGFENDVITLRNFAFIAANEDGTTFEMHRLVQLATLQWLRAQDVYDHWRHQFLVRLSAELPGGEYENWGKCQALFPHALSVSTQRPTTNDSVKEWATILYRAAWFALRQGKGIEAEELSVQAMKARNRLFNKNHEDVMWSTAMVALVYILRGRWNEAEKLQVQVMETCKAKLGADHPDTLTSMNNLALTYMNQGRWEEAEKLGVQVMETRMAKLGADHPNTLTSMNNLASTYRDQGRWEEAEKFQVQVMETRTAKLGADHPDTLNSIGALALTYGAQGRWKEAEKLGAQVMETRMAKLGADHPDTLTSMNNLASTYRDQGRWEEAEKLGVQVMETSTAKLGADHPDTLTSMGNLASTYRNQSRWEEAEKLEVQVMETCIAKLGADHPDTLTSIGALALAYGDQGRWEEAEKLGVQVMETRMAKLGADHPNTLTSMNNLALTYRNQGRWEEAEKLGVQVMETRTAKLGADHPDTLTSMGNLASTYRNQGRWEEAEKLEVQVMETHTAKLGADHPDTLTSMNNLAHTWKNMGKNSAAIDLMLECVCLQQLKFGLNHPYTQSSASSLDKWRSRNNVETHENA